MERTFIAFKSCFGWNFKEKGVLSFLSILFMTTFFGVSAFGLGIKCNVCGMEIPDHARYQILLKKEGSEKAPFHICSLSCAKKALKYDSKFTQVEVADFNHPDKYLKGDQAFFFVGSQNIKSDLGGIMMPPYLAAFDTQMAAELAAEKYHDGKIVLGFERVLK